MPKAGESDFASADEALATSADAVLARLRTYPTAEVAVGALSVTVSPGRYTAPSCLEIVSDNVHIGWVALGHLFLYDERQRAAVLDGLTKLEIPTAPPREPRPEAAASTEWNPDEIPNVFVAWAADKHLFRSVPPEGPSSFNWTFALYNPTSKLLWAKDQRLLAPACIVAARLGLEIAEIELPSDTPRKPRRDVRDRTYGGPPPYKVRELHPRLAELVPENLFSPGDLQMFAQIERVGYEQTEVRAAPEPTELLERLTSYRLALFPDHTYLEVIGTCRICERPGGRFRTPICTETLAYCHRCLAAASTGLPNHNPQQTTARATVAVRALADHEFGGAAFAEPQLTAIRGDLAHPLTARDVDRRLLLRIAVTRRQLAWTRILIDAGLAEHGVRLSRGTALKAVDGHLCSSMLEKVVDDFLHENGIEHSREPLYPFDEQFNPNTRLRADWLLSDGTLVEMWGMPDDRVYADKMRKKIELAARHQLRLVGVTPTELGSLSGIFADWARRTPRLFDGHPRPGDPPPPPTAPPMA